MQEGPESMLKFYTNELVSVLGSDPTVGLQINIGVSSEATLSSSTGTL